MPMNWTYLIELNMYYADPQILKFLKQLTHKSCVIVKGINVYDIYLMMLDN